MYISATITRRQTSETSIRRVSLLAGSVFCQMLRGTDRNEARYLLLLKETIKDGDVNRRRYLRR